MPGTRKLPQPIKLKDGRKIATLGQARELMLARPERHQIRLFWQYAAELLIEAAGRGNRAIVGHHRNRRRFRRQPGARDSALGEAVGELAEVGGGRQVRILFCALGVSQPPHA
jgi:hypothetical protein